MDEQNRWITIFVTIIIVATIVILLNPGGVEEIIRDGYRLMSIFFGMLAGTALGEVFKIRNNKKSGRVLLSDLLEELRVNLETLKTDLPLRKGFWILGIRSGRAEYIPGKQRRMLWEIYSRITHYNDDIGMLHRKMIVEGKDSLFPEMQKEIDRVRKEINTGIVEFLEIYS
ncbi:MAG: hypothetical protein ACTSV2_11960 [Candidatus Thorarchaeota archaeon]